MRRGYATRTRVVPAGCWLWKVSNPKEDGVRVTTAFNRLLALPGARVTDVLFGADQTNGARRAGAPTCCLLGLRSGLRQGARPRL